MRAYRKLNIYERIFLDFNEPNDRNEYRIEGDSVYEKMFTKLLYVLALLQHLSVLSIEFQRGLTLCNAIYKYIIGYDKKWI